jgi:hypothetical protein
MKCTAPRLRASICWSRPAARSLRESKQLASRWGQCYFHRAIQSKLARIIRKWVCE